MTTTCRFCGDEIWRIGERYQGRDRRVLCKDGSRPHEPVDLKAQTTELTYIRENGRKTGKHKRGEK